MVMDRENHKYLEGGSDKGNFGISVRQIQAPLALAGIGFLLALISFGLECVVGRSRLRFERLGEKVAKI